MGDTSSLIGKVKGHTFHELLALRGLSRFFLQGWIDGSSPINPIPAFIFEIIGIIIAVPSDLLDSSPL